MPKKIYNIPLCKYRKKEKAATVQHVHTSYMYTCEYVSGKPTDSSPRNRFKTSPYYHFLLLLLSLPHLPISYLSYPSYLYIHTCYLHGSSFLLHVLKKAKRLKESFSESASSVCYLLPPRKTYLMKRDVDSLPLPLNLYVGTSYMYNLVCNTLYPIPYPLSLIP